MAKQVKPETPPRWYAVYLTVYYENNVRKTHQRRLSLGKLNVTAGRTMTVPPATSTGVITDWNKGYRIVEALRPCVERVKGIHGIVGGYTSADAFLEINDIRMVGA